VIEDVTKLSCGHHLERIDSLKDLLCFQHNQRWHYRDFSNSNYAEASCSLDFVVSALTNSLCHDDPLFSLTLFFHYVSPTIGFPPVSISQAP